MNKHQPSCQSLESVEAEVTLTLQEYDHILNIQKEIFELMTQKYEPISLLEKLCLMAETLLPNSVASIMLLNSVNGLMSVKSAPSIPEIGHQALEGLKPGPGGGSCGNAVFRNEAQFVIDTKTDERWSDIRHIAYDFNLCSCWSMPIRNEAGEPIGSFALSSFEHRSPSIFHKKLLEICAFIVNIILKKSEYEHQIVEYHDSLEILNIAIENSLDGMMLTDHDNHIIRVNNAFLNTFEYSSSDDVIGKKPNILSSGRHDSSFYKSMWESLLKTNHWSGEIWNKRTNGEIFPEWISITAIPDNNGQIKNYLAVFTDLSELHVTQDKMLHLAYYDQLTGFPNRQKIILDMKDKHPFACVVINIDNFKEVNDLFGITAGDDILKQLAGWFVQMGCSPYRIGGDEFATLFDDTKSANELMEHIKHLMDEFDKKLFKINGETVSLRLSAGIAMGEGKLLTRADIALNKAKKQKNTFAVYEETENIEDVFRSNLAIAAHIRHRVEKGELFCHYQPIINMKTGHIDKYESLVRMYGQQGEFIPPNHFLPIAKKIKLYPQITREVVSQSCRLFANRDEEFSINLSDSDMRDPSTVQHIIQTIQETKTAGRVVFEILESEGIENYDEIASFIEEVKSYGAKIAIDDFGTGYSNFENILKLNVDYIKIDGSLIKGVLTNPRHNIIIETIVDFTKKIGAKTIAEFVSDEKIYDAVKNLNIDYAQGYYTGRPDFL